MSTPWTTISRSPLALSMRMSVLAPGQPTAVRTSLRGGRLMTRAARCCGSLEDPAVDLEHLGELAADVDAAREGDVADVVLAGVVAVALALVAGQGLHLLLDVALLEPHVALVREVEVVPGDLVGQHRGALEGAQALLGDGLVSWCKSMRAGIITQSGSSSCWRTIISSRMSWRTVGKVRTSKSYTLRSDSGMPRTLVAARTSCLRTSFGKPSGTLLAAVLKAA